MTTAIRSCVKSCEVKSLANGNMLVEFAYKSEPPEEGATPVGVLTRMAIALELQRMIEKRLCANTK